MLRSALYMHVKDEFKILYQSLFENATHHMNLIRLLNTVKNGMTRNELINKSNFSSGGTITNVISELEESGFISSYLSFDKISKEAIYKLTDEYSLFYLKFVESKRATGPGTWLRLSEGNSFRSWSGYAFEAICIKHLEQLKIVLNISY